MCLAIGVRTYQILNITLVKSLLKHISATMLILSPTILLYMQTTQKRISPYTVTRTDRDTVKTKVSEDKNVLKETFEQSRRWMFIQVQGNKRIKMHFRQCTFLFVAVRVLVTDLAV